eukprot:gene15580-20643_t
MCLLPFDAADALPQIYVMPYATPCDALSPPKPERGIAGRINQPNGSEEMKQVFFAAAAMVLTASVAANAAGDPAAGEKVFNKRCQQGGPELNGINGRKAAGLLARITNNNLKGEYYLTDLVEIARSLGGRAVAVDAPEAELSGCNNRAELAQIEHLWQQRRRHELMVSGVTMIAPETVFLRHDPVIGQDALIEPNVVFGPGVTVEGGAVIHAFSHLEGAHVATGATVGPFARLRPGANLAEGSKVGNFCEVKKAKIGKGAK